MWNNQWRFEPRSTAIEVFKQIVEWAVVGRVRATCVRLTERAAVEAEAAASCRPWNSADASLYRLFGN
ncbi:MAG: hypothetical protein ACYCSS_08655 [Sulfuriferula sp.]